MRSTSATTTCATAATSAASSPSENACARCSRGGAELPHGRGRPAAVPGPWLGDRPAEHRRRPYGGSGVGNGGFVAAAEAWHRRPALARPTLPPLGVLWLKPH